MDSVTQFVLGAGVSCAFLGRHIGLRKAALTGGFLGTLPDLDVLIPADNAIDAFISHRGWSHSLVVHAAATPLLGEAIFRLLRLKDVLGHDSKARFYVYVAVFLCLSTHALLDAMTVYGTRLFWPVWNEPVGLGSIFIIDPLYTLPLLVITLWALVQSRWSPSFGKGLAIALIASTGYLGWTVTGQVIASQRSTDYLAETGVEPSGMLTTPTPFNSLFWRTIAIRNGDYINIYIPLFGDEDAVTAYQHARNVPGIACWLGNTMESDNDIHALAQFSKGFFKIYEAGADIRYADLRMGITPNYAFTFTVAERGRDGTRLIDPERVELDRSGGNDWDWLRAGIFGDAVVRQAEAGHEMKGRQLALAAHDASAAEHCS